MAGTSPYSELDRRAFFADFWVSRSEYPGMDEAMFGKLFIKRMKVAYDSARGFGL